MPQSAWLKPDDFKDLLKSSGKTPYISKKIKDALKQSGASRFMYRSATKKQAIEEIEDLQEKGLLQDNKTAKKLYEDTIKQSAGSQPKKSRVNLATMHLPEKLEARNFISYLSNNCNDATTARLNSVMREYGFTRNKILTKDKMKMVLHRLRDVENVALPNNAGILILEGERNRVANVRGAIADELNQQEITGRFNYKKENKQNGPASSALRPAASSISQVGENKNKFSRSTSIARNKAPADNQPETEHKSSGSRLRGDWQQDDTSAAGKKSRVIKDLFLD